MEDQRLEKKDHKLCVRIEDIFWNISTGSFNRSIYKFFYDFNLKKRLCLTIKDKWNK